MRLTVPRKVGTGGQMRCGKPIIGTRQILLSDCTDDIRRHDHHEFSLIADEVPAFEQGAKDWYLREARQAVDGLFGLILDRSLPSPSIRPKGISRVVSVRRVLMDGIESVLIVMELSFDISRNLSHDAKADLSFGQYDRSEIQRDTEFLERD